MSQANGGLLASIRVIDMAQFVAGSYCTMLLGDLGADVLKIEIPPEGDPYRRQGPEFVDGQATLFLALNRNKRGVAINWKTSEGLNVLLRLIQGADVFVENARPGSLTKYGLDYESLSQSNPRLIYCSLSGYGQTGPYAPRGGFDLMLQGEGALMAVTGESGGGPVKVGVPVLDIGAAVSGLAGILGALYSRERSGRGGHVESSLLDFSLALLTTVAQSYFASGEEPQRMGTASPQFAPYRAFKTADGSITVAGAGTEALWQRLCRVLGLAELIEDPRFKTNTDRVRNQEELAAILESVLVTLPSGEWLRRLEEAEIPAGRINSLGQLLGDPHVQARQAVLTLESESHSDMRGIAAPLRIGLEPLPVRYRPPRLGEHTGKSLLESGFTEQELDDLLRKGVISSCE